MIQIQSIASEQAVEQDQGLRAIVAPGSGRNARVRAPESRWWIELDEIHRRDLVGRMEFIGNAERVAHQQPDQASL
jgi:hypothetical protein